jgi:hypothetical protein
MILERLGETGGERDTLAMNLEAQVAPVSLVPQLKLTSLSTVRRSPSPSHTQARNGSCGTQPEWQARSRPRPIRSLAGLGTRPRVAHDPLSESGPGPGLSKNFKLSASSSPAPPCSGLAGWQRRRSRAAWPKLLFML